MATELDNVLAELGAAEGQSGFFETIKEDTAKSFRAAGMVLGMYKPQTPAEAKELRKRFISDAAMLGVSAFTGGVGGAAMKSMTPVARAILGGALSLGAGSAAGAAVVGEDPLAAGATGAVLGAGFGALGAGAGAARKAMMAGRLTAEEAAKGVAAVAKAPVLTARQAAVAKRTAALTAREEVQYGGALTPYRQTQEAAALEIKNAQLQALYEAPPPPGGWRKAEAPPDLFGQQEARIVSPFEPDIAPGVTAFESAYRGPASQAVVRPIGERLRAVAESGVVLVRAQLRDARGRFAPREVVERTEALAGSKDFNAEAAKLAREVGEDLGNEGRILARTPSKQRGYRGPRVGARGRVADDAVVEAVATSAPAEIVDLATSNSLIRRTLLRLGEKGDDLLVKTGTDTDLAGGLTKVYGNVADFARRAFVPVGSALARMGQYGAELGMRMSGTLDRASRLAAQDIEAIRNLAKVPLKERLNVAHVLHGDDVPMNGNVAEMAKLIRDRLEAVGIAAKDVRLNVYDPRSGGARPFALRENYYPLEYSKKTIRKYMQPGPERDAALARIMQSEQSISRKEAEAVLERFLKPHLSEFRYGHLQIARNLALPGWEEDPLKVLPQYFLRGWKRIETAREFGPQDEAAIALARNMAHQGFDEKYALDAYRVFADKEPVRLRDLAGLTRTLNMWSLLSTTGLVQFSQHSNTIALTGWKNYLQGLATFLTQNRGEKAVSRAWVANTGAYTQELLQDLVPFGERGAGAWWANFIGLTPLDKANRIVAALAGRYHADDIAAKLVKETAPKAIVKFERQLTQMGLSPAAVREAGGVLTSEQRSIAAQQISLASQFRGSSLDLPLDRHSPAGQFIYLFKNFAIQQTRFVKHLMDEAYQHGNWEPMIRYLSATGLLTGATGMAVQTAKYGGSLGDLNVPGLQPPNEEWSDKEFLRRYLEGMLLAGSVGIAADGLRGMFNGPEMLRSFMLGPTFNDAVGLFGKDLPELARGNPQQMLHDTAKHIPLLGRRAADWLFPLE